jgi:hypothetical protein
MSWGEAFRLSMLLANDPGSQVCAALVGWSFPASREWIVAADHRDSTEFGRVGRKAKAYPRPWADKHIRHLGGRARYSTDELRHVLDRTRRTE